MKKEIGYYELKKRDWRYLLASFIMLLMTVISFWNSWVLIDTKFLGFANFAVGFCLALASIITFVYYKIETEVIERVPVHAYEIKGRKK